MDATDTRQQTDARTIEIYMLNVRDHLRNVAVMDSVNEYELHRMADRLDGLNRIRQYGHHVACATRFNRQCDCNGAINDKS